MSRTLSSVVAGVLLVLPLTLMPRAAHADAVAMDTCAEGWTWARHGHGGACEPISCEPSCAGDCVDVARCFETASVDRGDAPPDEAGATYERPLPTLCDVNDTCTRGAHCVHRRECRPRHGGCSVSLGRASGPTMVPLFVGLATVAVVMGARRRRR